MFVFSCHFLHQRRRSSRSKVYEEVTIPDEVEVDMYIVARKNHRRGDFAQLCVGKLTDVSEYTSTGFVLFKFVGDTDEYSLDLKSKLKTKTVSFHGHTEPAIDTSYSDRIASSNKKRLSENSYLGDFKIDNYGRSVLVVQPAIDVPEQSEVMSEVFTFRSTVLCTVIIESDYFNFLSAGLGPTWSSL
jgi:hypothetical protein